MCPRWARAFFPSEGECERSAVPAVLTQEAEIDPNPGMGDFRPRRAGAFFAAFGGGGVRTLRRAAGELLPGGSRGLQKGVQDTPKDVVSAVAH